MKAFRPTAWTWAAREAFSWRVARLVRSWKTRRFRPMRNWPWCCWMPRESPNRGAWRGAQVWQLAGALCLLAGCANGLKNERMTMATQTKTLGEQTYKIEPLLTENFDNLDRWVSRDTMGKWEAKNHGVEGEWITGSPSLFLKEKLKGDFIWEITATRLTHDKALTDRFHATKHGDDGKGLESKYNFNFWIRADAPPGENFLEAYPKYLKTGWNGMGDDHWHSYFNTVVWDDRGPPSAHNWNRLRRSPGYEMVKDIHDVV